MKRICVFCGSSSGIRPDYIAAVDDLAEELLRRNVAVVYGGANIGLMGRLANTMLARGGHVTGVMPEGLRQKELQHLRLTEIHIVGSMHERKATMNDLADGFIALPGGFGTLDETFEVLTWAQLGLHAKPFGFLNVCNYYDRLFEFLEHTVTEQFVRREHRDMVVIADSPKRLLDSMAAYAPPVVPKWVHTTST